MMESEDYNSDAPEELTADQGIRQDEGIRRTQKENKARVAREGKERRRLWAQRKTARPSKKDEIVLDLAEIEGQQSEAPEESRRFGGMLPNNIVQLLAIWAQRKTARPSKKDEIVLDLAEIEGQQSEAPEESRGVGGMLPNNIVQLLATREKQVLKFDAEDEKKEVKLASKRKKAKISGVETVILKEMPPAQCLQNSLEFLKKRKTQIPRSSAVLNNSNQAFRLLSTSGLLTKN